MRLIPKNWQSFQHYKDRDPPWIKLHKRLLDDYDFQCLQIASKALAPMLWLLASEHANGEFEASSEQLAFRLRWNKADIDDALAPLIEKGFFFPAPSSERVASNVIALRQHDADPETYKPTTEETPSSATPTRARKDPTETSGFTAFWDAWPKTPRKTGRFKCFAQWRTNKLEPRAAEIVQHVLASINSSQWRQGYDPAPLRYLKERRYDDPVVEAAGNNGRVAL